MNLVTGIGASIVIAAGLMAFLGSVTGPPKCRDGFVASWNMPKVGWVCLAGYTP